MQQSVTFVDFREGRRKKEEGRRKREEGRRKKEEGRRKREEGRGKREEGRGKKEEGRREKEEGRGNLGRKKARSPEAGRNVARRGSGSSNRRQTAPAKHSQAKLGERA
ncbi:hypothetical protein NDI43_10895 [Microcoleus vaginatus GB2-A3]|uniref:hypothetical protein n=1 Tax=Microcoleus vaginatus TaxID=119532 RepID=UPI0032A27A71